MENIEILRSQLMEKIFSTKNIGILKAVNDLLESVKAKDEDEYIFSESQKELLMIGEEDIKYGRVTTDEEIRKLDEEWMR